MTKRTLLAIFILGASLSFSYAFAVSVFDIEFPIPELENCADKTACKVYCDDAAHEDACFAFAQKYGLVDEREAEQAKKVPKTGPGGCQSDAECRAYCDDISHGEECVQFAVENGFMDKAEGDRALKGMRKTGPGGCRGEACRTYCDDSAHHVECFEFAHKEGLISDEEYEGAKEVSTKGGPGGCKEQDECRAYCADSIHIEECAEFAESHGFIGKEEAARVKKFGVSNGPGGCQGQEACHAYCQDAAHQTECIDFAEQKGFMSREEAERARKFAGKTGPGGCRGEQCRTFCENPDNAEACIAFGEEQGLISKEESARGRKFIEASKTGGPGGCKGMECRQYCEDSSHHEECFAFAKKQGLISPEEEKEFQAGAGIRKTMEESGGPGGCKSESECQAYCTDGAHVEECVAFASVHGGVPPEEAQRMVREFTQQRYDNRGEFHPEEEFQHFEERSTRHFEEFRQLEQQFRGKDFPGMNEFRGAPGEFPGRGPEGMPAESMRGGPPQTGGGNSVGPGGCSSADECIKFCTEHKEECFSRLTGPQGSPGFEQRGRGREQCCPPPGEIRLRSDLVKEFNPQETPEFKNEDERHEFYKRQYEGSGGMHEGQQFPPDGRPQEFPGSRDQYQRNPEPYPSRPPQGTEPYPPRQPYPGEQPYQPHEPNPSYQPYPQNQPPQGTEPYPREQPPPYPPEGTYISPSSQPQPPPAPVQPSQPPPPSPTPPPPPTTQPPPAPAPPPTEYHPPEGTYISPPPPPSLTPPPAPAPPPPPPPPVEPSQPPPPPPPPPMDYHPPAEPPPPSSLAPSFYSFANILGIFTDLFR